MGQKTINPRLADFMGAVLKREGLGIVDLCQMTGHPRWTIGAVVRGEVRRIHPEIAKAIADALPITLEQLLAAAGHDVPLTPQRRLDPDLVDLLSGLTLAEQRSVYDHMVATAKIVSARL